MSDPRIEQKAREAALYVDGGVVKCPLCKMPMSGYPESHLFDCQLRSLQEAALQSAVAEEREECAQIVEGTTLGWSMGEPLLSKCRADMAGALRARGQKETA